LLADVDSPGFKLGLLLILSLEDCEAEFERLLASDRLVLVEIDRDVLNEMLLETEVEPDWLADRLLEVLSLMLVERDWLTEVELDREFEAEPDLERLTLLDLLCRLD